MYQNHHHQNYSHTHTHTHTQHKQKKTFLFHCLTQEILVLRVLCYACVPQRGPDGPVNNMARTDLCPKGAGSEGTTIKTGVEIH